jgi:hypothetical protein
LPRKPKSKPTEAPPICLPAKGFPNLTLHPKVDLIGRIISAVEIEFDLWLQANPDKAGDERNQVAREQSMTGLGTIFDIIDDYDIGHRKPHAPDEIGTSAGEIIEILKEQSEK